MSMVHVNKKGAVARTGYGHNDDMLLQLVRSYIQSNAPLKVAAMDIG